MKIRIPKAYETVMDWIACHVLPPNKPTGLKLFGYAVTWLDLAMVAYPAIAALALGLYFGNMLWWFIAIGVCMAFAGLAFQMLFGGR